MEPQEKDVKSYSVLREDAHKCRLKQEPPEELQPFQTVMLECPVIKEESEEDSDVGLSNWDTVMMKVEPMCEIIVENHKVLLGETCRKKKPAISPEGFQLDGIPIAGVHSKLSYVSPMESVTIDKNSTNDLNWVNVENSVCKKKSRETILSWNQTGSHTSDNLVQYKPFSASSPEQRTKPKSIITNIGVKSFKCDTCGNSFARNDSLISHMRTHTGEKPYSCDTCGKSFIQRSNLSVHARIHTGDKPYRCSDCGKNFLTRSNLSDHEKIHTGEKTYKCNVCGKSFVTRSNLSGHLKTHSIQKQYKCDSCGKTFVTQSNLSVHTRKHTGERPYMCDTCGKGFVTRSNLSDHTRIHTGEKKYKCNTCGKCFFTCSNLLGHTKTHTTGKIQT